MISEITGWSPVECPWSAFDHPLVQDVITLFAEREYGISVALVGGDWSEAPACVVQGLALFDGSFRSAEAAERERKEKREERKRRQQESQHKSSLRKPG